MKRKTIGIIVLCLVVILCVGAFVGCDKPNSEEGGTKNGGSQTLREAEAGRFYTLQEAYDESVLSVEDLQTMANYLSTFTQPTERLSQDSESKIKELAARDLKYPDAKAEDFTITKYFGTYNGCVTFIIKCCHYFRPAVVVDKTIAGVEFHYPTPDEIIVWKEQ